MKKGLTRLKKLIKELLKKILLKVSPTYRTARRIEEKIDHIQIEKTTHYIAEDSVLRKTPQEKITLAANMSFETACFALQVHETHKASFSEFRECHTGQSVVIVATGPTMKYYSQMKNMPHIGVNAAYKRSDIKLEYYFMTDYLVCKEYLDDLKDYDCVKFIGQFSVGTWYEQLQAPEEFIRENHARRFFAGTPSQDIHVDIEYYPLGGFYSVVFQALHFALYTNPKRIYLVGCDCSKNGYFDGTKQNNWVKTSPNGVPMWFTGWKKFSQFIKTFYPNVEIVSINPVGLKGLFHDVYTEDYLKDYPEIEAKNEVEILMPDSL